MRYNWGAVGIKHRHTIEPNKEKKILKGFSEKQIQEMLNKSTKKAIVKARYNKIDYNDEELESEIFKAEMRVERLKQEISLLSRIEKPSFKDKSLLLKKEKELSELKELLFSAKLKQKSGKAYADFKKKHKNIKLISEKIGKSNVSIIR